MRRQWLIYLAALVAFLAYRNGPVINVAFRKPDLPPAYFATPSENASTSCKTVNIPELKYCEDATFWNILYTNGDKERIAIVSCDQNRKVWNTVMGPLLDSSQRGSLWAIYFDRNGIVGVPHRLELEGFPEDHTFHPLGVEVSPSKDGAPANMFVVNHALERSTIEQFLIIPATKRGGGPRIRWSRTISSRYLISPNSIAITSPKSFFVSNDHFLTRRLPWPFGEILPLAETLLAIPLGFIGYVALLDDAAGNAALVRHTLPQLFIPFPNGIALHPNGRQLAVASSSLASVFIYNRTLPIEPQSGHPGKLTLAETIRIPFAVDNIYYDDDGILLAAGHPFFPSLTAISKNTSLTGTAPSWVVEIIPRDDSYNSEDIDGAPYPVTRHLSRAHPKYVMRTVYESDGLKTKGKGSFSSSSTAIRDSMTGTVFISGLYAAEGVLICTPQSTS